MAAKGTTITLGLSEDIKEAQERFKLAESWESTARARFLQDLMFAEGDPDNQWQWPDDRRQRRELEQRPCLTINMVRQHNLQIINDSKKNKPGIKIRATGGGATYESAQAYAAIMRYIERKSDATSVYGRAAEFQVKAGLGAWRIETEYCASEGPSGFDQDLRLKTIHDPLLVYFDPNAKEPTKEDGDFTFVFEDVPLDQFERRYPKYKEFKNQTALGNDNGWVRPETIRIAEYYRKVRKIKRLFARHLEDGRVQIVREDEIPRELASAIQKEVDNKTTLVRKVEVVTVERLIIIGNKEADRDEWPSKYIPIVPVIGEEIVIKGKMDRKGHTRAMKDAQRMYNYWSSSGVEYGALQTKIQWAVAAESIAGFEEYWQNANLENYAYLPYRSIDEQGKAIPPPQRIEPPVAAPVALTGMQLAQNEMMRASGQFSAQLGEQGNERTGAARRELKLQGDTATFHYIDNLATAIRYTGRILLDMIPKIYDTKRVLMVEAEDGVFYELKIDPAAQEAFLQKQEHDKEVAERILNPAVGQYEVEADVGPGYATKREEAFEMYTLLLTQAPALTNIIGDLLLKAGDFAYSDEAASRLRRMIPPQALGKGPSEQEQLLMEENSNLKVLLERSLEEIAKAQIEAKGVRADKRVQAYDALTGRLKVILDQIQNEAVQENQIRELVAQAVADSLNGPEVTQGNMTSAG